MYELGDASAAFSKDLRSFFCSSFNSRVTKWQRPVVLVMGSNYNAVLNGKSNKFFCSFIALNAKRSHLGWTGGSPVSPFETINGMNNLFCSFSHYYLILLYHGVETSQKLKERGCFVYLLHL